MKEIPLYQELPEPKTDWTPLDYSKYKGQILYKNINTQEVIKVPNVHYNVPEQPVSPPPIKQEPPQSFQDQYLFRTGFWSNS